MRGTKKIDWLNHFLEFIVVVIGILLAFQLNTCREDKKEQDLVNEHLTSLMEETNFNEIQLSAAITNSELLIGKLDSIIEYSKKAEDINVLNRLSMQLLSLDYTYLKKNAYNSLVETGDIRFIKNFDMKGDIISLYEYYRWIEGIEESARITYADQYFPYVVNNLDLIEFKSQPLEIYTNQKFKNYLSVYKYSIDHRLSKQKEVLGHLQSFQQKHNLKE